MGLREGSGMLCIASMHRFRVTRGAKWALSRGADETVCILLQGDEEEEEGLRGREGAVGGSDKTGDMGAGGRHLHCNRTTAE